MSDSQPAAAVLPYGLAGPYPNAVTIPPELRRPTPRAVVRKPTAPPSPAERVGRRVATTLGVIAVVACVAYKLADPIVFFSSPTVPAAYVGKDSRWGGKAGRVDSVVYSYSVGGRRLTRRERVPAELYARAGPAAALRVRTFAVGTWRYDRLDRSPAEFYDEWSFGLYWLGTGLALAAVSAAWRAWRHPARRELRVQCDLVRRGTPAVARVVSVAATRSFRLGGAGGVVYEYVVGDWRRHGRLSRADDAIAAKLKVGDGVVVLHDPVDTATHRTYDRMGVSAAWPPRPGDGDVGGGVAVQSVRR